MSNTMQLTEKNLMVGDWVESNYGTIEVPEWKPVQLEIADLVLVSAMTESFNIHRRPIPLTEEILRKIEGISWGDFSESYKVFHLLGSIFDILIPTVSGRSIEAVIDDRPIAELKYLHQLQQLSRCLGHELVINF